MQVYATAHGLGLWDAMKVAANVQGVSTRAVNAARQFVSLVEHWRKLAAREAGSDDLLAERKGIVQTVMEDVVSKSGLEAQSGAAAHRCTKLVSSVTASRVSV